MRLTPLAYGLFILLASASVPATKPSPPQIGFDANYALDMERRGKSWTDDGNATDPFTLFGRGGCNAFRVRLWTGDAGVNGLDYAKERTRFAPSGPGLSPTLCG